MQKKKKRISAKKIIFAIVILVVILFIIFALTSKTANKTEQKAANLTTKTEETYFFSINISENAVRMYLPAVDNKGEGVLTLLTVEAHPGKGRTLVDIDNLLFWADTQHSIRVAKKVAQEITKINLSNYDIIYNIYANASIIGGESAGAALTIATIAALQNKTLNDKVIITGTINHDGTIGPVSAIMAKAKAAKAGGANLFLVPLLQSREVVYETRKHCEKIGPAEFCSIEQVPKRINVSEEANITVIEVGSIEEAIAYFIK